MDQLLQILSGNARLEPKQIAVMTGETEEAVAARIAQYEHDGVIRGYKPLIDYDKLPETERVEAFIEVRVSPKLNYGFEEIAHTVADFDEVRSVYLMSGGMTSWCRWRASPLKTSPFSSPSASRRWRGCCPPPPISSSPATKNRAS